MGAMENVLELFIGAKFTIQIKVVRSGLIELLAL